MNPKIDYAPTTPMVFLGLSMMPSSAFSFKNGQELHVNTWKSYEVGFNIIEMGVWLNERNTWSISLAENMVLNTFRFSRHYTLSEDTDGKGYIADKGEETTHGRLFQATLRTQLMVKWYKYLNENINEGSRLSLGLGLSLDETGYHNYSTYRSNGRTHAEGAGFDMRSTRLGLDFQASYDGIQLYLHQSFTPMFKSGRGPKCYPFSVGFGFSF